MKKLFVALNLFFFHFCVYASNQIAFCLRQYSKIQSPIAIYPTPPPRFIDFSSQFVVFFSFLNFYLYCRFKFESNQSAHLSNCNMVMNV